jgi:phospholipid/cholesterol/gamma-HCH transport system permease protein
MPAAEPVPATADIRPQDNTLEVVVSGAWRITGQRPDWPSLSKSTTPADVKFALEDVAHWDTSLVLFVAAVADWCREHNVDCDQHALPKALQRMVGHFEDKTRHPVPPERPSNFLITVGNAALDVYQKSLQYARFVGECTLSFAYLARNPSKFRWRDTLAEMQRCGAMALPITGLIAFLVGVILAYSGAVILRQFGGDIWVADLVGVTMTREMAAMMTAIVIAGRTGAAFAAEIGNMRANEEVDALTTLGIRPIDFLVMPRLIALGVMMPVLALYANALGIVGGMAIAWSLLDIPPAAFWLEMLNIVDLSDLMTGMIKATTFGAIIGFAGCLRGLQASRSASGVGEAATSAVVTSILLIIVSDAVFAVIFNVLGW